MEEKDFDRLLAEFRDARRDFESGPYSNAKNLVLQRTAMALAEFVDALASVGE